MSRRKTHEEFLKEVNSANDTTIILSEYQTRNTSIKCKCKICGYRWETKASYLIKGHGCPKCGRLKSDQARRKTHEQFLQQLSKANPNVEALMQYELDSKKIKCKCKICGYEWESTPSSLLQGKGCKQCHFNRMRCDRLKSHKQFIEEMKFINPNITILDAYHGAASKIKCKCNIHGTFGEITPNHLLQGKTFCKQCFTEKQIKHTKKENYVFLSELASKNPDIIPLEKYQGAKKHIKVQCKKCGAIWKADPSYLIHGDVHCTVCSPIYSKGEHTIRQYLCNIGVDFILHKTFPDLFGIGGGKLSYDFYIPAYNMLIEYQGAYHDGTAKNQTLEQLKVQQEHDKRKREYANSNNYIFNEIWYYEDVISKMDIFFNSNPCNDHSSVSNCTAYANQLI